MSRVAVDYSTGSVLAYRLFKKAYPSAGLTREQWRIILYMYNESFRDYILETGDKAKMPYGFGDFAIIKKKRKKIKIIKGVEHINLPIDWKKTREKGKTIYNFNYHSEGWFFGWKWFIKTARFRFSDFWYFKPSRTSSRLIAHYVKTKHEYQDIYKEWEQDKYIPKQLL